MAHGWNGYKEFGNRGNGIGRIVQGASDLYVVAAFLFPFFFITRRTNIHRDTHTEY